MVIFLLPFIPYTPHSISNFTYNSMGISFLMLSSFFLIYAFFEKNRQRRVVFGIVAGIVIALSALSYPLQIIICFIVCIIILILEIKNNKTIEITLAYSFGGLCTALVIVLILCIRGNGIVNLVAGIETLLKDNTYFLLEADVFAMNLKSLTSMSKKVIVLFLIVISFYVGLLIVKYVRKNFFKNKLNP